MTATPTTATEAPAYPWLPRGQLALLTLALGTAVFMNSLDVSIANVSIPTIAGDLAVSATQGTWIITSFAVSTAVAVPISGWLARRFGEVRLFVACTLLFTLFSLLCGLSVNFPMLLASRALQGAAAGPMIPVAQSLLLSNYQRSRQGFANGVWTMTAVIGPVAGPVLGGLITDNYRWNWIFFINVPIGLVVAALVWLLLRDRESPIVREAMDYTGLALLAVGLFCLQVVLDKGNQDAWFQSPLIAGLAIVAALALALFLVWELTEERPLVDLRIFSDRNFSIGCLTLVLGYMAYFSGVVLLPLWLQTALPYNYNATWAGYATSSIGICAFFASPIAGRLLDRHDPRLLMTVGVFIFAGVSFAVAFANTQIDFARVFLLRLPWGVGLTFFFTSLRMIAFSRIPRQNMAAAAGLYNFARLEALSIGTSFSIALWDHREALHDHHITSLVNPSNPALHGFLQRAAEAGLNLQQAWALLAHQIKNQAFMIGLNDIYWLSGWLFLALLGLVWCSHPVRQRSKPKPAAR